MCGEGGDERVGLIIHTIVLTLICMNMMAHDGCDQDITLLQVLPGAAEPQTHLHPRAGGVHKSKTCHERQWIERRRRI